MDYYNEPDDAGASYRDLLGEPSEIEAALGRVILSFGELEDALSCVISLLIGRGPSVGQIVTAGLSFRRKMDVLASLARYSIENRKGDDNELNRLKELTGVCLRAEQMRNQVIHSSYLLGFRVKTSASSKKGLRTTISLVDSAAIMNAADYCAYAAEMVELYPIDMGEASSVDSSEDELRYSREGEDGKSEVFFVFNKISSRPSTGA